MPGCPGFRPPGGCALEQEGREAYGGKHPELPAPAAAPRMQAARSSSEIATAHSGPEIAPDGRDADADCLAGFPIAAAAGNAGASAKPEQLSFDFGDEMSLFTRVLLREPPAETATMRPANTGRSERGGSVKAVAKAVTRADVSDQERQGLLRTMHWGR